MKIYTDLPLDEIKKIGELSPREQQLRLAYEIVRSIHGEEISKSMQEQVPVITISSEGKLLEDVLVEAGTLPSKSEVRRRCMAGSIKIDGHKISDSQFLLKESCSIRAGKKLFLKILISER